MPSSPSPLLRTEQQATGENVNVWGQRLNAANLLQEEAIAGFAEIALTGNRTLTTQNYATDEARMAVLAFTDGGLASAPTITIPANSKTYDVINDTGFPLTFTAGGVTGTIGANRAGRVLCKGTDVAINEPIAPIQAALDAATAATAASQAAAASSATASATSASASASSATDSATSAAASDTSRVASVAAKDAAEAARAAAEAARDTASGHRLNAQNAEADAEAARDAAIAKADEAAASEAAAATSATSAATSATASAASASAALASQTDAQIFATQASASADTAAQIAANIADADPYLAENVVSTPATTGLLATDVEGALTELRASQNAALARSFARVRP